MFFVFLHMIRFSVVIVVFLLVLRVGAQDVTVPVDLRQHNLTEYNSSLFNPAFSLDRNNPQSIALWTRWQWQTIDGDPTTIFLNYSRKLNRKSAVGATFFQHNTGVFLNTGGALNYAYAYSFSPRVRLGIGVNLFGFKQKSADDRIFIDPQIPFPEIQATNDFIMQMAPGLYLTWDKLGFGLASENLFDYNFTTRERHSGPKDRIYMASTSYDFYLIPGSEAVLRPSLYWKSIPRQANQVGLNALYSTNKYWGQAGYNNFYGISVGGGGRFFKKVSVGALMEFATKSDLSGKNSTFEVFAAYHFGPQFEGEEERDPIVIPEEPKEEEIEVRKAEEDADEETRELEKLEEARLKKEEKAIAKAEKEEALAAAQKAKQQRKDSLDQVKRTNALAAAAKKLEESKRKDSIAAAKKREALVKAEQEALVKAEEEEALAEAQKAKQREKDSLEEAKKAGALAAAEKLKEDKRKDSITAAKQQEAIAQAEKLEAQKRLDSIDEAKKALADAQQLEQQRKQDSLDQVKLAEVEAAKKKAEQDKLAEQPPEEVKAEAGEKYEEVKTEDGLQPGFYLITNVFGTQEYFEAFMQDLTKRGLEPKSFLRSLNNYNYVYLKRYDTMGEARKARDSKYDGRYTDKTWIFRVVGQ